MKPTALLEGVGHEAVVKENYLVRALKEGCRGLNRTFTN